MGTKNWLEEGNKWIEKGDYQKAIDSYEKAIALNPNDADAYNNKGVALDNLGEYQAAITCYDQAIALKPDDVNAYNNKGTALGNLGEYQAAITCYDQAIALKPNVAKAYNNKGVALVNSGEYQAAIMCYDQAIALQPDDADAYINKGVALYNLGEYQAAITCYDQAIALKPDDAVAYNNKGNALGYLGEHQAAITCYNQAIALKPDDADAYNNRKIVLQIIKERKQDEDFPEEFFMRDHIAFFEETTKGEPNQEPYKKIYAISLKIMKELQIRGDDHEANVAHYTTKKVAQILFFDKKENPPAPPAPMPFRLNSITNSNDIQEGKTLFIYLFDHQKIRPQLEQRVAFVGCFMFNHDNLNQFRLYGKDAEANEGTGISIVMKPNFFCQTAKSPLQQSSEQKPTEDDKDALYRCIYIDPDTNQVASVGHRDYHTFYKVKDILYNGKNKKACIQETPEKINAYKEKIDEKTAKVATLLEELKGIVNDDTLNREVVCNLLLNLRYLVKHVAFKEEQECRIVKIKSPSDTDVHQPKDEEHQRFYMSYLPLNNCVRKIYFGPKASGIELFQSLLTYQEGFKDVICYRSTSPLA